MFKNFLIFLFSIFLFSACSTKNIENKEEIKVEKQQKSVDTKLEEDDDFDEFDDEFKEELEEETQKKKELLDPLGGYNRLMTKFNDKFYIYILDPSAKAYAYVLPKTARKGISNFFNNLMYPIRLVNNLLQFKFENAAEETGRFVVNTTIGIAGLMDPAKEHLKWDEHKEDFGQTLGYWGVGSGFHVVLPFLGPSNLRDMVGFGGDTYLSATSAIGSSDIPYKIPKNATQSLGLTVVETINTSSFRVGQYENLKKDAIDLYPFLRDIYEQRRKKQIEE